MNWMYGAAAAALLAFAPAAAAIDLEPLGQYRHGSFESSAAEITAYDPASKRLFVVNGESHRIDVLDMADPARLTLIGSVDLSQYGSTPNSVDVHNGLVAAAMTATDKQAPGKVVFFNAADLAVQGAVSVGAMPDMLTFTPDGAHVLTANEGEPNAAYSTDPEGSVSIIDLVGGVAGAVVRTADFRAFTYESSPGLAPIGRQGSTFAQDAEPEYIALSPDGRTAYVTLQEVNAVATIDIAAGRVTAVRGLGFKDWSQSTTDLDDRDGGLHMGPNPVFGIYQPDAIAGFVGADGGFYLVTANEGDSKDLTEAGGTFSNEARGGDVTIGPQLTARVNAGRGSFLRRVKLLRGLGYSTSAAAYEQLYLFGARSMSIWDANAALVYDSGDALEREIARRHPRHFNANHNDNAIDNRSDDKGPEPEGVAVGAVGGRTYAFVGLERDSGVAVFDVTAPREASLVHYETTRDFRADPRTPAAGDLGPEGVMFIPAAESPNGRDLLVVTYEVSSTTRVYAVTP